MFSNLGLNIWMDFFLLWNDMLNEYVQTLVSSYMPADIIRNIDMYRCVELKGVCFFHNVRFRSLDFEGSQRDPVRHIMQQLCDVVLNGTSIAVTDSFKCLQSMVYFYQLLWGIRFWTTTIKCILHILDLPFRDEESITDLHKTFGSYISHLLDDSWPDLKRIQINKFRSAKKGMV